MKSKNLTALLRKNATHIKRRVKSSNEPQWCRIVADVLDKKESVDITRDDKKSFDVPQHFRRHIKNFCTNMITKDQPMGLELIDSRLDAQFNVNATPSVVVHNWSTVKQFIDGMTLKRIQKELNKGHCITRAVSDVLMKYENVTVLDPHSGRPNVDAYVLKKIRKKLGLAVPKPVQKKHSSVYSDLQNTIVKRMIECQTQIKELQSELHDLQKLQKTVRKF